MSSEAMKQKETTGIAEFNQFEHDLAEYKERYEGVVYDFNDTAQEKQARSDRLAIGRKVAELDRVHKDVKSPLKAKVDLLDGERKRIKDGLLLIQGGIKSQIDEHEAKVQAHEDELAARVEAIRLLAEFDMQPDSALIRERMDQAESISVDDSFENHEANAALAQKKTLESLDALMIATLKAEAEQAELARLRKESEEREQKEREQRIAAEAKAQAEKAAEESIERERQAKIKAEQDAQDAADKWKRATKDAAEKAEREKAEAVSRAENEAKQRAEKAERDRLADIERERALEAKRVANKQHRAKINRGIVSALIEHSGLDEVKARRVVTAVAKDLIPGLLIKY